MSTSGSTRDSTATCPHVALAGIALLEQCGVFIEQVASECGPDAYAAVSSVLPGGTIGKHVRHCLDHYRAALEGFELQEPIDYDHRERNVPMEREPAAALGEIQRLSSRLRTLGEQQLECGVRVRVMLSGSGEEAELGSTLGRELAFATHHAVHHHAMMGAIAAELGLRPHAGFGKAPSTINHEQTAQDSASHRGS